MLARQAKRWGKDSVLERVTLLRRRTPPPQKNPSGRKTGADGDNASQQDAVDGRTYPSNLKRGRSTPTHLSMTANLWQILVRAASAKGPRRYTLDIHPRTT